MTKQTGIVATVFGGDNSIGAYGIPLNGTSLYVALPSRLIGTRPEVTVSNPVTGHSAVAEIWDVGPWNIADPYWLIGRRPEAESGTDQRGRKTNLAGIDISPALARAIGIDGKGKVDWDFYQQGQTKMTTPIRRVIDIYHNNIVTNLTTVKNAGIWGVIHKATEGLGYVDSKYNGRKAGFLELGMLWGAYHFGHPGSIPQQVDYFLSHAGIDDHTLYALDWEQSSTGTMSAAEAEQFMRLLEQKTGRKGVVYSGNVAKEQIHGTNAYLGSCRLWLAQYGSSPTVQPSWSKWWLWQYSDGTVGPAPRGCPGVSGGCDTNSWPGSQTELAAQWSGKPAVVPPQPVQPTVQVVITAPPGVTVNVKQVTGA